MIVDRHDPMDLFGLVADLKLEMEPELEQLDKLLEDEFLFEQVKADLCRRHPNSATLDRHSTPVEVILRMLVVKRLYDTSGPVSLFTPSSPVFASLSLHRKLTILFAVLSKSCARSIYPSGPMGSAYPQSLNRTFC